ncbi:RICIN domain-containing protein [Nonomuraea sp. NPDC049419]|uniref:RICIN domain-containing protein n=1 Tax=Nonomuraea sp. NPDC049419 TaxID=3155772 RepID=UPI00342DBD9D
MALIAVVAGSLAASSPANAVQRWHVLENIYWPNECLDVNPHTWFDNPGYVSLYPCHEDIQQRWYTAAPVGEIRTIGPPYGPANKCLDAWPDPTYPHGFRVSTWDCNGGAQQQWSWQTVDLPSRSILINVKFNLCLDTTTDSGSLGLYSCHANHNQQWRQRRSGT